MSTLFRLISLIFFSFVSLTLYSQESCKVLKPEIAETYKGKCKKGLANGKGIATGKDRYEGRFIEGLPHGDGTYTWSSGETYKGEWLSGQRHGIGKYTMPVNGKDSIQDGLWSHDQYMGPKPPNPSVLYKTGVDRYTFQKTITDKNRVLVNLYKNGMRNTSISNFLISSSSGYEVSLGEAYGYDGVTFPVTIKIQYTTTNKLGTMPVNVKFDFVIHEPGDWTVNLNN